MSDEDHLEELRRRMALEDAQPSHNGTFNEANVGAMQSYLPFPIFHPQSAHMGQTPAYSHVPQMVPVQASQGMYVNAAQSDPGPSNSPLSQMVPVAQTQGPSHITGRLFVEAQDNLPLSQRLGVQEAAAQGSEDYVDEEESSLDEEMQADGASTQRQTSFSSKQRSRRNILPRIMRGQRCGYCHTCLNPQMKKACLTMRQRQMEELQAKGELPISMIAQPIPRSGALPGTTSTVKRKFEPATSAAEKPRRAAAPSDSPEDPFTREVTAITNRKGGVEVKFLALLQRMYQREKHLERQLVLMTILKQSPPGTLQEAVKNQKIVIELQSWIQSAVEHREFRLAFRVLETLDRLPIDLTVLKSTGIGKTLAKLKKSGPEELRKGAEELISKWKKALDSAPAATSAKRARDGPPETGTEIKKPKIDDATKVPVLPRQASVDSKDDGPAKKAAPLEVDDTAMFERKKPALSLPDSIAQTKKAHQIKLLDEDQSKKAKQVSDAARPEQIPDAAETREPAVAQKNVPIPLGWKDTTSPASQLSTPLGSSRLTGLSTGITRIGGIEHSLAPLTLTEIKQPLSAAARAAEAAAKIPDPPPLPSKPKRKTVSWAKDADLLFVRHYNQTDPVEAVKEDADPSPEAQAARAQAKPPGFQTAAAREHQNEAAALRRFRQNVTAKEDDEDSEILHPGVQLQHPDPNAMHGHIQSVPFLAPAPRIQATVEWPTAYNGAPFAKILDGVFGMPSSQQRAESGSFQALDQAIAGRPAVHYSTIGHIPNSPTEPPMEANAGIRNPIPIPFEPIPNAPPVQSIGQVGTFQGSQTSGQMMLPYQGGNSQTLAPVGQPNGQLLSRQPQGALVPGQQPAPTQVLAQQQITSMPGAGPTEAATLSAPHNVQSGPFGQQGQSWEGRRGRGRGPGRFGRSRDSVRGRGRGVNGDTGGRGVEHHKPAHLIPCKWFHTSRVKPNQPMDLKDIPNPDF